MSRKPLNHLQYLAELNQQLRADPEFREGMEFKLYPDGKIGGHLRDADAVGSCTIPAVFLRIEQRVACRCELVVPIAASAMPEAMLA